MVVVGAAILPHGALPFDGDQHSESSACRERYQRLPEGMKQSTANLYHGTLRAAEEVARMSPDLIVLHSPHGISLSNAIGVYVNDTASGTALWNGQWAEFKTEVQLDKALAEQLVTHFRSGGVAAEGIRTFSGVETPLRWGEVIPMWYLTRKCRKDVKFIVITQPLAPLPTQVSVVGEPKLQVGRSLFRFLDGLDRRVAVVISGDLSHTYHTDCTDSLYLPAPGWNLKSVHDAAVAMENAFISWVKSRSTAKAEPQEDRVASEAEDVESLWLPAVALPWLEQAATLQPKAYSCGLVGFMALHAILEAVACTEKQVSSHFFTCQAPTYYGMMAATFRWK